MTDNKKDKKRTETNEIFIGNKPFMKYVIATMIQLEQKGSVIIKARGKFISRGVDVAEVVKKRIKEKDNTILSQEITIGTDEFEGEEGKHINVSTIDISLNRN
ncbi:MAG: DNA-binding protein Alba [Nanoarchaeota archaeon]